MEEEEKAGILEIKYLVIVGEENNELGNSLEDESVNVDCWTWTARQGEKADDKKRKK